MTAAAFAAGEVSINVSEFCAKAGISRKTFYKWVARYRSEGVDGLQDRSRRPHSVPGRTSDDVEDAVVRKRKELADAGLDHGATTIAWHLEREDAETPSVATIHRILVRRGLVDPQPHKRPKSSWKRFEAAAPNEVWQIDATIWETKAGVVHVFNIVDDHSRLAVASIACATASSLDAWGVFSAGAQVWGLPAGVLSDNGLCFSGKLRGFEVEFEQRLRAAGVRPFTGRVYHPQTTGKVERFQQTLKKWLRRQPMAKNLVELQSQLDEFCRVYNHERPHQGIGRVTPFSRFTASALAGPADEALERPNYLAFKVFRSKVSTDGSVQTRPFRIGIGSEHVGKRAVITTDGVWADIWIGAELIERRKLDLSRHFQRSGRPPGRPRREPQN